MRSETGPGFPVCIGRPHGSPVKGLDPTLGRVATLLAAAVILALAAAPAAAQGACSETTQAAFTACKNEIKDDYWIAVGICLNSAETANCLAEAAEERQEARDECGDQYEARQEVCNELGEAPYMGWDGIPKTDFADETEFCNQNPYLPIAPGSVWVYEAEDETITVQVENEYKLIDGVTCIVVNDVGEEEEVSKEDTDDWIAVDLETGDVHYCGEISQDFEWMDQDLPPGYELVEIEGSWKTGRDGARSGILMPGTPGDYLGEYYRQEWALADAEDMGEMVSIDYEPGNNSEIDDILAYFDEGGENELVEALEGWCQSDCVVTRDFTPVEPDAEEYKFYAFGIGLVLEVAPPVFGEEGEIEEEGSFVILDEDQSNIVSCP